MKKIFLLSLVVLTTVYTAQDATFLNGNQSLVNLNPSFAGSNGGLRNQLSYRNQWPQLTGNIVTYANSFDAYIKPLHGGIAFSALIDDAGHGTLKTTDFNIAYAQHFNFLENKLKIIPSLQFGYSRKSLDVTNLHFGDMIDPRAGYVWNNRTTGPSPNISYFDFGTGLLVQYTKDWIVGVSFSHLNQPKVGLLEGQKLPYRLNLHTSYYIHLNDKSMLQLFYRYQKQGSYSSNQFCLNSIIAKHYILGVGYNTYSGPMFNIGYRNNVLNIQLGYDVGVSKVNPSVVGPGSWEVQLGFSFLKRKDPTENLTFENW
jgi:type IX secretion system PorP/SprF family membrane protein